MKLFYRETGEGSPVVMLHGVFGSSDNLLTLGKILAKNHKVYILDARNHGHSPQSDEFTYDLMAEDLKDFLDYHQIKDPVIIGHSMGGKTVMKFAAKYEAKARKFVILDISPRFYKRHHDEILNGLNSINLAEIHSRGEADAQLAKTIPEAGVRQFLLKNLERTDNGFVWRLNLPVITQKIDNIGEELPEETRVHTPVLFLRGGNSGYIQERDEDLIKKYFPDSQIKTVENAGHWLHAEQPVKVAELINDFIESF